MRLAPFAALERTVPGAPSAKGARGSPGRGWRAEETSRE